MLYPEAREVCKAYRASFLSRSILLGLCFALCRVCGGQTLLLASARSEGDLLNMAASQRRSGSVTIGVLGSVGTNVFAVSEAGIRTRLPLDFSGNSGWYRAGFLETVCVDQGAWSFRWGRLTSDLFEGNRDAVRLYLAASRDATTYPAGLQARAAMDRSDVSEWRIEYSSVLPRSPWRVTAAFRGLEVHRVQRGTLTGSTTTDAFSGRLYFLTTRGLPSATVDGHGYALDFGVSRPLPDGASLAILLENVASTVRLRNIQLVEADVLVNEVVPDEHGFLHAPAWMSGQARNVPFRGSLKMLPAAVYVRPLARCDALVLARRDRDWRAALGVRWPDKGAWVLIWPSPGLWQAGLKRGRLQGQIGWYPLIPRSARHLSVGLGWSLPIR